MPTPFTNTLRSLNADGFRAALIGLGVALVLLIAWGGWFVLARMTVYEVSTSAIVARDGFVIADFPSAKLERIRRRQAAWLYPLSEGAKQPASVPAVVIDIISLPTAEPARVKLFPVLDRDLSETLGNWKKLIYQTRRIGLRLRGVPRGAYWPYVTLGTTPKTEPWTSNAGRLLCKLP